MYFSLHRAAHYMDLINKLSGASLAKVKNAPKQIILTVAVASERTLNVVLKTPKVHFYSSI